MELAQDAGLQGGLQEDNIVDFTAEPTDAMFTQAFIDGLADGTLALSESESEVEDQGKKALHKGKRLTYLYYIIDALLWEMITES